MKKVVVILSSLLFLLALTSWTVANTESKEDTVASIKSSSTCHVKCVVTNSSGQPLTNAKWQIQGNTDVNSVSRKDASFETDVQSGDQIDISCSGYNTYTTDPITQDEPNMQAVLSSSSSSSVKVFVLQEK